MRQLSPPARAAIERLTRAVADKKTAHAVHADVAGAARVIGWDEQEAQSGCSGSCTPGYGQTNAVDHPQAATCESIARGLPLAGTIVGTKAAV